MSLLPALLCLLLLSQAAPVVAQPRCLDINVTTQDGSREKVSRGNRERPAVFFVEQLDPDQSVTVSVRICDTSLKPVSAARLTVVEYTEDPDRKQGDAPSAVDLNPDHPGEAYKIVSSREGVTSSDGSIRLVYHPVEPRTKKLKKIAFLVDWSSVDEPRYLVYNFSWSPGFDMPPVSDPGNR